MDDGFGYHDLERAALGFVLEAETWPVFIAWAQDTRNSTEVGIWLESGPDLNAIRREWLRHSPDPDVRTLADL